MLRFKRLRGLSFILGLVGALAMAVPASAEGPGTADTAVCALNGQAKAVVNNTGGTGTYHFTSLGGKCVVDDASDRPFETGLASIVITSDGTFTNVVCGTGTAKSSPSARVDAVLTPVKTNAKINAEFPAFIDYTIDFKAFVGTLSVSGGSHVDGTGASGTGVIQLGPPVPPPKVPAPGSGVCTHGFTATGAVSLTLPDN
jgi:hypothetical protein